MIVLGITGGIGSGKTTVSEMFSFIGVPVYNADTEAKKIMESSEYVKAKICSKFGDRAYVNGNLNKNFISSFYVTTNISYIYIIKMSITLILNIWIAYTCVPHN